METRKSEAGQAVTERRNVCPECAVEKGSKHLSFCPMSLQETWGGSVPGWYDDSMYMLPPPANSRRG